MADTGQDVGPLSLMNGWGRMPHALCQISFAISRYDAHRLPRLITPKSHLAASTKIEGEDSMFVTDREPRFDERVPTCLHAFLF